MPVLGFTKVIRARIVAYSKRFIPSLGIEKLWH
jgi:hypothetical protein